MSPSRFRIRAPRASPAAPPAICRGSAGTPGGGPSRLAGGKARPCEWTHTATRLPEMHARHTTTPGAKIGPGANRQFQFREYDESPARVKITARRGASFLDIEPAQRAVLAPIDVGDPPSGLELDERVD